MKTLGKLKLNQFSKEELDQRKMNALKGGCDCLQGCHKCGCDLYAKPGVSDATLGGVVDSTGEESIY